MAAASLDGSDGRADGIPGTGKGLNGDNNNDSPKSFLITSSTGKELGN